LCEGNRFPIHSKSISEIPYLSYITQNSWRYQKMEYRRNVWE